MNNQPDDAIPLTIIVNGMKVINPRMKDKYSQTKLLRELEIFNRSNFYPKSKPSPVPDRRPAESLLAICRTLIKAKKSLPHKAIAKASNVPLSSARRPLQKMSREGHITEDENGWKITESGQAMASALIARWSPRG